MDQAQSNSTANWVLIATLIALGYCILSFISALGGRLDPATMIVAVAVLVWIALLYGLRKVFSLKLPVAIAAAVLVFGVAGVDAVLRVADMSLMRALDLTPVARMRVAAAAPRVVPLPPSPASAPTAEPTAQMVPPPPLAPPEPPRTVRLEYPSVGTVVSVLPADPAQATAKDGASFLGYNFRPGKAKAVLRVRVVANAYAAQDTVAAVAIFREGQPAPLKLESKPVPAGGRALFDITVDVPLTDGGPVGLDVRAGPARPGTIVINGPDLASKPADVPLPSLTIEER